MRPSSTVSIQIGKNGLTDNLIFAVKNAFNAHENVKISVLKAATRSREETEKIAQQLCTSLGKKFTYKIIGFTIFIKKWRKLPSSNKK